MEYLADCPCKKNCSNHGYCEPCRKKHYSSGSLPYCERPRFLRKIEKFAAKKKK